MDQIDAVDRLLEALAERGVGADVSTRDIVESLDDAGLEFRSGDQRETIKRLDVMDADDD